MTIDVVIGVYKPDIRTFNRVKEMLKKQTVKNRLHEIWNKPEPVAMNTGVRKSKGAIVVIMSQDCVPEDERWLERLISPFKDKKVVASVSDTYLPKDEWKKYDLITRMLIAKEQKVIRSRLDARACAYRKKVLYSLGLFDENPKLIGIDSDMYLKLKAKGKIAYPGCKILHIHPYRKWDRLRLERKYSLGAGAVSRRYGGSYPDSWKYFLRAIPILGLFPLWYVFPYRRFPLLAVSYLLFSPILHAMIVYSFWKGYLFLK